MAPRHHQHARLHPPPRRLRHPQRVQLRLISLVQPIHGPGEPGDGHMIGQQRRHRQAQQKLPDLRRPPAGATPRIQRPKPKARMRKQRAIQQEPARHPLPDRLLRQQDKARGLDRHVQQRVVQQMQRHIDEQHQPADQAHLPQPRSEQPSLPRPNEVKGRFVRHAAQATPEPRFEGVTTCRPHAPSRSTAPKYWPC